MFLPSMDSFIEDICALADVRWLGWSGAVADHWHAQGRAGGHGYYLSPDPRIVVFLEPSPAIGLSTCPDLPGEARLAFVPAGVPIWSTMHSDGKFSHLDIHFSALAMPSLRNEVCLPAGPVLLARHAGIEQLALMMLREIDAQRHDPVLLDSLLRAMLAYFRQSAAPAGSAPATPAGLTPRQRRRVLEHIDTNLHRRIAIAELAEAAGLGESWFARAFRNATGETPARAVTRRRIERTKSLLRNADVPLVDIAGAAGFSDQAHFTRVFRTHTGTTPAVWRSLQP
ncbi:helix-turn-helix transcriptional regulator [Pararhodobacter sp.]|uniref:helix-turn-helix transcriptional regulator n=1 Tax=Pararhodobacter sp. TaxID=2127056 RepID=UPI002FDDC57A